VLNLPKIITGMTAILLQVTALRELMTVFSGNELDIGITLAVWLIAVGTGSYAGRKTKIRNAFPLSFLVVALLAQPTVLGITLIRPLLSAGLGETLSLAATVIATVISLFPLCFVIGAQFPLAVSYREGRTETVYSLEAAGSFIGGVLFTLFLSGRLDAFAVSAAVSIVDIAIAALLLRKSAVAALLVMPILLFFGSERLTPALTWRGAQFIQRVESRYGAIEVVKIQDQFSLYASGKFLFSYPDPQTEELKAHLPMTLHPLPSRVLAVGGSPAVLRELLKYPVEAITFVEIDPELIRISLALLNEQDRTMVKDQRVTIVTADARRFVKVTKARYDLIVLNLPEPSTASINRFYTSDFFGEARRALKNDGLVVLSLPVSFGYVGKQMRLANGSVFNSLRQVFKHVELSSEEYGVLAASDGPIETNPDILKERFARRKVRTVSFHPSLLNDIFSPLKVSMVRSRLGAVAASNTDNRPAAYLYNLMLWLDMQGSGVLMSLPEYDSRVMLVVLGVIMGTAAFFWRKKAAVSYSIFMTGYSAMAFSLVILLAYQAAFGSVYEMIGLLSAVFMAGVAVGAYGLRAAGRPLQRLRLLQAGTVLLLASTPLFLRQEVSYYALNFLVGITAGAEFSAASRFLQEHDATRVAGKLYAVDLMGSFPGALLTAVIFVPLFGIQQTVLFVVILKLVSLILLSSIRYEKA
jgi:spermidine synthase